MLQIQQEISVAKVVGRPFKKGQSGNPAGKPKGSRHKLGTAFIEALHADFIEHGPEVVREVRETKPDQYMKVIAGILPKELEVTTRNDASKLTDDELADIAAGGRTGASGKANGTGKSNSVH